MYSSSAKQSKNNSTGKFRYFIQHSTQVERNYRSRLQRKTLTAKVRFRENTGTDYDQEDTSLAFQHIRRNKEQKKRKSFYYLCFYSF